MSNSLSSRYQHDYSFKIKATPKITKASQRLSPLKLKPQFERCFSCDDGEQGVACLDCSSLLCIRCGLTHQKQYQSHQICEMKDAFQKLSENVRQLDVKLSTLAQKVEKTQRKVKIDHTLFEESMQQLIAIQNSVKSQITQFFKKIGENYINLWNSFIEIWGNGSMMSDRISQIQLKLQTFLSQGSQAEMLNWFFKEMIYQEAMQLIDSCEKRDKKETKEWDDKSILIPPRLLIDDVSLKSLSRILEQSLQIVDWGKEDYKIVGQMNLNEIPIIPVGSKYMYLYNVKTKKYQIGDFQDLRQQQLPFFNKSVLSDDGSLYLVGGANSKGIPSKSFLKFQNGELFNLAQLPVRKNPANSLIIDCSNIYLIGGLMEHEGSVVWSKSCEKYQIKDNIWINIANMHIVKPNQSIFRVKDYIYVIGEGNNNMEKYSISQNQWQQINLQSYSLNPFDFGSGYIAATMNENQVILFGGKLENNQIIRTVFEYKVEQNTFISLGDLMPGNGVSYGDYMCCVYDGKIVHFEQCVSKLNSIHRWLTMTNVLEFTIQNQNLSVQLVQIMSPD